MLYTIWGSITRRAKHFFCCLHWHIEMPMTRLEGQTEIFHDQISLDAQKQKKWAGSYSGRLLLDISLNLVQKRPRSMFH
jgi:hypothetical protein